MGGWRPRSLGVSVGVLARAGLALGGGITTWLAFPPVGLWPLAVVGVAALCLAVRHQPARRGAWLGALHGAAMFVPLLSWIAILGPDTLVLLGLLEALFAAALGAALAATSPIRAWPVVAAGLWVGVELLRAWVPFGGFPWGRLAFAQADAPFASYAAYGGVALVTAMVAVSGAALALCAAQLADTERIAGAPARWRLGGPVLVAAVLGVGLLLSPGDVSQDGPPLRFAIVQGNVPGTGTDALGEARTVTRNHLAATEELAATIAARDDGNKPQVVIWPENSTDIDPFRDAETREVIEAAVDAVDTPILVGAILDGPGEDYRRTAGVLWNPGTGPDLDQVYVKRHPVPFGEYIPFREQLLPLIGRLEDVGRDTYAGDRPGVIDVGAAGARLGVVICFEIAYDDLVRDVVDEGAEVVVVQTNNATFGGSAQPEQQFAISRLRAIETGKYVLVASTNGISGVISPNGTVRQRTEMDTRAVIETTVVRSSDRTMASRLGAWPEWLLTALGLAGLGAAVVGRRRQDAADG